jgi:hypothetical protein
MKDLRDKILKLNSFTTGMTQSVLMAMDAGLNVFTMEPKDWLKYEKIGVAKADIICEELCLLKRTATEQDKQTVSVMPKHGIGDVGQRYEVYAIRNKNRARLGWCEDPTAFKNIVANSKYWTGIDIVDRKPALADTAPTTQ